MKIVGSIQIYKDNKVTVKQVLKLNNNLILTTEDLLAKIEAKNLPN